MTSETDLLLSRLTVKIKNSENSGTIGSGVIYYNSYLKNKVYVLTAAHVLFGDKDELEKPFKNVLIEIWDHKKNVYQEFLHKISYQLVSTDINSDVAVLVMDKSEIEYFGIQLIDVFAISNRLSLTTFALKGFPNATKGQELVKINPTWIQNLTGTRIFQLQLNEDYSGWAIDGFSGSGIFLYSNDQIFLFGIFSRYREEQKGKVIYGQYIESVNDILKYNFLDTIKYNFFSEHIGDFSFFKTHAESAIKNLGPRFNEELNFNLPIATIFEDLAKGSEFKTKIESVIDKWLMEFNTIRVKSNLDSMSEIVNEFETIKSQIRDWWSSAAWEPGKILEIGRIKQLISLLSQKIDETMWNLRDLQWKKEEEDHKKGQPDLFKNKIYESEIYFLSTSNRYNHEFLDNISAINFEVANSPVLIVKGEAGSGKSHLFGDIANERIKNKLPAILLLGQLFKSTLNVWQSVLNQLGLKCSKEEFLLSLNNIGKQIGARVIILIDALNEGSGKELWVNELAGFIEDFKNYQYIGLALSIRSSYFELIVSSTLRSDNKITIISHTGFKGNEYKALALFCKHYKLNQPKFPILNPEFSNPLFMNLICEGLANSGIKDFPKGFNGITDIFNLYINSVTVKLSSRREVYKYREQIIKDAIFSIAKRCFESDSQTLLLKDVLSIFDINFVVYPHLLDDLIAESVLVKEYRKNEQNLPDECIYFSFERLGDFYIAETLIKDFGDVRELKIHFQDKNSLGKLLESSWNYFGVLSALSVLLPEKYSLEIFEAYDWVYKNKSDIYWYHKVEEIKNIFLGSLKWRSIRSIDDRKISNWLNDKKSQVDSNDLLTIFIELSTIIDHPFNSDRLFKYLSKLTMKERDAFFQYYLRFYSGTDDYGTAHPLRRLIDWAWSLGLSSQIDIETARLTGQALVWVLSSTNNNLRDESTKALVNLLEEQPETIIELLKKFELVDDPYIQERLYAIAYGVVLRTSVVGSIQKIAQYIFDKVYKDGSPPNHILLRDYSRNTIEYALYSNLQIVGDVILIEPPYNQVYPLKFPSEEEIKKYRFDKDSKDYEKNYLGSANKISFSVLDWDFGRYVVESGFRKFASTSFTLEFKHRGFKKSLNNNKKKFLTQIEQIIKFIHTMFVNKGKFTKAFGESKFEDEQKFNYELMNKFLQRIEEEFSTDEYSDFIHFSLPFLNSKYPLNEDRDHSLDIEPIQRWIVQRVFELGYDSLIHGKFDSEIDRFGESSDYRVERIGKKYQWIAYHEMMSIVSDHYKMKEDNRRANSKLFHNPGGWVNYVRDIDPAFITSYHVKYSSSLYSDIKKWTKHPDYDYWNIQSIDWLNILNDIPQSATIIQKVSSLGIRWLVLKSNLTWKEPKPLGGDKYGNYLKYITYYLSSYLIQKSAKSQIIDFLTSNSFRGEWLPETHRVNDSLFNRENYWSRVSMESEKEVWKRIKQSRYKLMPTLTEAVGSLSDDKSGAHFNYNMPCKLLFDGMNLKFSKSDGDFENLLGEVEVITLENGDVLINFNSLKAFLDDNNLDIIWTIYGEKNFPGLLVNNLNRNYTVYNGVFYLKREVIDGSIYFPELNSDAD